MERSDGVEDEASLLDLLNSTPIVDGVEDDLLATAQAGRAWLRAHGHSTSSAEWQSIRAARSTLQAVLRGQRPARALAPLLNGISYRPAVSDDGLHWRLEIP